MCRAYKEWVDEHGAEQSLPSLPDLSAEQLFFLKFAQVLLHIDRCHTNLHFALIQTFENANLANLQRSGVERHALRRFSPS